MPGGYALVSLDDAGVQEAFLVAQAQVKADSNVPVETVILVQAEEQVVAGVS
jgi:hypothetical protein